MKNCFFSLSFLLVFSLLPLSAYANKGYKIAKHCEVANQGYRGELSLADMILETSSKRKPVTRKLQVKRLEKSKSVTQSLLTFLKPVDVKGTKLLTWSKAGDADKQWIYLNSYGRTKRVSSRSKTGSFMGSEFSYEDLGGRSVENFKHKFVKENSYKNRKVWVLDQKPNDKYSGYSKLRLWMDKEYKNPLKIEYFDRKGALVKKAFFQGYRKVSKWWRPKKTIMTNVQTRKKSTLVWKSIKLGQKLSKREFEKEYLKN